ncbi:MAG: tetraacyldisaccharide 4'-kinase [Campylobacter sp.]|nr:tetraacyldisaccharide 4'-kinase [Campylobacter sp.]
MTKKTLYSWINKYFYSPNFVQKLLSIILIPLSIIYSAIIKIKKLFTKEQIYSIPIINVGNLILGGSGKTPLCIAINREFSTKFRIFIVLRGYKRDSKGLFVVSDKGEILKDLKTSGDEAMEYALNGANVIVSEDRKKAINKAINLGANLVILDDGFSKFHIKKFEILLPSPLKPANNFTIPSGVYRYPKSFYKFANFIPSKDDIISHSYIENPTKRMVLVTGIANPDRLKKHFSSCIAHEFFPDHHSFTKDELTNILSTHNATSLLVTNKDYVKIKEFNLPISRILLDVSLSKHFIDEISAYIGDFYATI